MKRLGIGIVGCGNIATIYMRNAALFPGLALRACADLRPEQAARRAAEHGIRAASVDALLAAPDIDLVINLTVPAAHAAISQAALAAGKHVFTEKPLGVSTAEGRSLLALAETRGLLLGAAPDTFLGPAGRLARQIIDAGRIGRVVTGTAFMMGRGMEHWHPDPAFYYQKGAGPVLDMGPYYVTMLVHLLGPVRRVMAMGTSSAETRLITAPGPLQGTHFAIGTPTTHLALLEFASGTIITFGASWDVFRHSHAPIELHGTAGSLRLPDPDTFGGTVSVSDAGALWEDTATETRPYGQINWPDAAPDRANYRMLGVADLAASLREGRPPRASGRLALHVLETLEAILVASETGAPVSLTTTADQPAPFDEAEARALRG
ncbi:Gfo/Idh/MocA family protein [Acidisoma sp. 7E03]